MGSPAPWCFCRSGNSQQHDQTRLFAECCEAVALGADIGARTHSYHFDLTPEEFAHVVEFATSRLTQTVKRKAAGLANWTPIDENYAWARFTLQLQGWSAPREFFAIRERIRENKSAVGRRLIEVDGYTFRVFVTNRQGDAAELWRDYNQRACCEQHIEELKNDLQADGF